MLHNLNDTQIYTNTIHPPFFVPATTVPFNTDDAETQFSYQSISYPKTFQAVTNHE